MPKEMVDSLVNALQGANTKALGAMGVPTPPPGPGELTEEQKKEALRKALEMRGSTKGADMDRQQALAKWIEQGGDPKDFPMGKQTGAQALPSPTPTPRGGG